MKTIVIVKVFQQLFACSTKLHHKAESTASHESPLVESEQVKHKTRVFQCYYQYNHCLFKVEMDCSTIIAKLWDHRSWWTGMVSPINQSINQSL